jgi:hypothetical protein
MTTKWMGLWAQDRPALYAGQVIKKADIPKYTRLVLRFNKFYERDSGRPKFVYCFADSEGYSDKCVPIEIENESGEEERLYTREEVQYAINRATQDALSGYTDNLVEDYL